MDLSLYANFSASVVQQESQINALQAEISSGVAVQTAAQNPGAFETATLANDQLNALSASNNSQAAVRSQLGSVSSVYTSVSSLLDNVQSVIEQALNGTTDSQDLQSIATQVQASAQQLLGLGNTTGSNGTYLFGGSRGNVAPFQTDDTGNVIYLGDGGQSQAAIAPGDNVSSLANGEVFVNGLSGDGVASVSANAANTGSGVLIAQGVVNPAAASAFQAGSTPITVSFANGPNGLTYTAAAGGNTISTGDVTSGLSLQLGGEDFQISGTPAAGDRFTLAPARPQSAFSLLQTVASALTAAGGTPAQQAQTRQTLNQSLSALAQYQQGVVTAQAQTGVTLQAVTTAAASNATQSTALQSTVQNAIGVDTPTAITNLDESVTALEAAMKAFGSVQNLSLFNYL
jgi:flagellar hook-associated protein 3 FlgL